MASTFLFVFNMLAPRWAANFVQYEVPFVYSTRSGSPLKQPPSAKSLRRRPRGATAWGFGCLTAVGVTSSSTYVPYRTVRFSNSKGEQSPPIRPRRPIVGIALRTTIVGIALRTKLAGARWLFERRAITLTRRPSWGLLSGFKVRITPHISLRKGLRFAQR